MPDNIDTPVDPKGVENLDRNDPEYWTSLSNERNAETFSARWLRLQCGMLEGEVVSGAVVLGSPVTGPFSPVAVYPVGTLGSPILTSAIESAITNRRTVTSSGIRPRIGERERIKVDVVAYPLLVDDQICGAAGVELESNNKKALRRVADQLGWGVAWMEAFIRRSRVASGDRLVTVLKLIATSLQDDRFQSATTSVATELAGMLECDRVSIGFLSGKHTKLRAVSHSASFGKRANIVRAIEDAMDEAIDQQALITYPRNGNGPPQLLRSHDALAQSHGAGAICTIPLAQGDRILGAMLLERGSTDPFDVHTTKLLEHIAALLGPLLDMKRKDDRWLLAKAGDSARAFLHKLLGPRRAALKLVTGSVVGVIVFLALASGQFRVTADARLEGAVQRSISSPIAGYIAQANFRAGDVVKAGEIIVALDNNDLNLERLKVDSQQDQYRSEYGQATAAHDRARAGILAAQIDQAQAQLSLIDAQLGRMQMVAPFDGIVVNGDLSQSLGAPVERGDVLFEIAPLEDYRIILQVDERDVAEVREGQSGSFVLSSLPDEPLPMLVTKVTPVATAEEGMNYFLVEASLSATPPALLRPGMEGVGKIEIDERKLLWIWTYKITHWLRLLFWSWWP